MREPIPVYVHLRRAKDLMDREYARELDVPALAREAHASRAHFVRSFKKAFGETPHQYLLQRRIERAKELLRSTGMSVTEVSAPRSPSNQKEPRHGDDPRAKPPVCDVTSRGRPRVSARSGAGRSASQAVKRGEGLELAELLVQIGRGRADDEPVDALGGVGLGIAALHWGSIDVLQGFSEWS